MSIRVETDVRELQARMTELERLVQELQKQLTSIKKESRGQKQAEINS
jgi:uncharacterized protein YlxW (UPF0749 family)